MDRKKRVLTEVRDDTKSCSACGKFKPFSEFYKAPQGKNGLTARCKGCYVEYAKRRDPNDHAAYMAEWRERNPEAYRAISRRSHLKRHFGLSEDDYEGILADQDGGCAICGAARSSNGKRLHVDHDHHTGKVRGLLCSNCNTALGLLRDDPTLLTAAIEYLQ